MSSSRLTLRRRIKAANHRILTATPPCCALTFTTFTSLSIANEPLGMLHLGDRGDGATAGKETARQRYAHINAGHVDVPDFIRFGVKPQCYELKFLHPLLDPLPRFPRPRPRLDGQGRRRLHGGR